MGLPTRPGHYSVVPGVVQWVSQGLGIFPE